MQVRWKHQGDWSESYIRVTVLTIKEWTAEECVLDLLIQVTISPCCVLIVRVVTALASWDSSLEPLLMLLSPPVLFLFCQVKYQRQSLMNTSVRLMLSVSISCSVQVMLSSGQIAGCVYVKHSASTKERFSFLLGNVFVRSYLSHRPPPNKNYC